MLSAVAAIMSVTLSAYTPPISSRDAVMVGLAPHGEQPVIVRVVGSGCTRREDVRVHVDDDGLLSVERLRPDRCRKRLEWVEFRWSLEELGTRGPVYFHLTPRP